MVRIEGKFTAFLSHVTFKKHDAHQEFSMGNLLEPISSLLRSTLHYVSWWHCCINPSSLSDYTLQLHASVSFLTATYNGKYQCLCSYEVISMWRRAQSCKVCGLRLWTTPNMTRQHFYLSSVVLSVCLMQVCGNFVQLHTHKRSFV